MKFSTSLLILACSCAIVVANPHANAKHQSRKAAETHHKERSVSKSKTFDLASTKSAINSGADSLTKAVDVLTPLARDAFSLGSDLATRVINGAPNDKQGRANDANLLARADKLVNDVSETYKRAVNSEIVAKLASLVKEYGDGGWGSASI